LNVLDDTTSRRVHTLNSDPAGPRQAPRRPPPGAAATVVLAAAAVVVLWLAYLARSALLLVYLSALIAIGISPIAAWIEQRRLPGTSAHPPRWLAALLVYIAVSGILIGISLAVVPPLVDQAQDLATRLPSLLEQVQRMLANHGLIAAHMSLEELVDKIPVALQTAVLAQFWNLIGGIFGLLLILVLSLYLLHDAERLRSALLSLVPRIRRRRVSRAIDQVGSRIGAWMMAQLMLSGIIGATTALGLGLLGVPYFYVLAVLAAIGEFVPYAGPFLAAVPGLLLAATVSWETVIAVAIFYLAQQQLENHVLVPNLMQHQVGLTPSVVIIAVTIGGSVLGILGAIIAVPTAAILRVAWATARPTPPSPAGAHVD
jgi:predicted PurR-regulated permease PerM